MGAQRGLPWGTWATKAQEEPRIDAPRQFLQFISPVCAIHSSTDRVSKVGMSWRCPRGLWVSTMSKERTHRTAKTEMLSQTGNKHLQNSGNQKRNAVRSSGGQSNVCHSAKSCTKIGERSSLEGWRRRRKFFPKTTFHVFSV